jgi:hypothetical protein
MHGPLNFKRDSCIALLCQRKEYCFCLLTDCNILHTTRQKENCEQKFFALKYVSLLEGGEGGFKIIFPDSISSQAYRSVLLSHLLTAVLHLSCALLLTTFSLTLSFSSTYLTLTYVKTFLIICEGGMFQPSI